MEEKYPIRYQELPKEELLEDAKKVWKELQTYDISRVRHVLSAIHDDLSKDFVSDEVSKRIQEFLEKNFLLQMLLFAFVSTDSKEVASLITELIHLTIEKSSS